MTPVFRKRRPERPRSVGLALGSGAARGWAHIGVIRALMEAGIEVEFVAGTSIGSLVGAAFASGKLDSLEAVVRELDWKRAMPLFDVGLPRSGLLDGHRVTASLRDHIDCGDIRDLSIPFSAVSTDLVDGSEVVIGEGDIIEAVRASISVPGVFTPVQSGDRLLVDGGLVNPVPAGLVRKMGARFVIAVDLNHGAAGFGAAPHASSVGATGAGGDETGGTDGPDGAAAPTTGRFMAELAAIAEKLGAQGLAQNIPGAAHARQFFERPSVPNILEVVITSLNIMEMQITDMHLAKDPPDLLIRPDLGHLRPMDFHRGEEAISEGYRAARAGLQAMRLVSA